MIARCPDRKLLARFLIGDVDETSAPWIDEHLAACPDCLERAHSLAAEDTLVSAMRGVTRADEDREPIGELVERLKGLRSRSGTHNPQAESCLEEEDLAGILAPPQAADEIGRLGGYRVKRLLGIGGMGVVFEAEDVHLKRPVALKAMRPSMAANRAACRRFLREAQAVAAIEHDHIVTIYQVGEDRGVPFLAMKLLEGTSLQQRLDGEGRLPLAEVLRIARQLALGLQAAHERGLLHRDIKPDNIWLEHRTGRVKIVDFGLARSADDDSDLTRNGTILGTPRYMAPEQARGGGVDHRCDLFSLGVLMYRALTGKTPFEGENIVATLMSVANHTPPAPADIQQGVPAEVSALIMRLLEKDPARRFPTAADVVRAIDQVVGESEPRRAPDQSERDEMTTEDSPAGGESLGLSWGEMAIAAPRPDPLPTIAQDTLLPQAAPAAARAASSPPRGGIDRTSRRWPLVGGGILGLAVLAAIAAYGVLTIRLASSKGDVVIECLVPEVEVLVKRGDETVNDFQLKQGAKQETKLEVGEYEIAIQGAAIDGVKIENQTFILSKGDQVVVKVYRNPPKPVVLADKVVKAEHSVSAEGIELMHDISIARLVPGATISNTRSIKVRRVPEFLLGRRFSKCHKYQGRTRFRVLEDQDVYLAMQNKVWGGGGNSHGNWKPELVTRGELEHQGWKEVAELELYPDREPVPPMVVFHRRCKRGEEFLMRNHKYFAPVVIWGKPIGSTASEGNAASP